MVVVPPTHKRKVDYLKVTGLVSFGELMFKIAKIILPTMNFNQEKKLVIARKMQETRHFINYYDSMILKKCKFVYFRNLDKEGTINSTQKIRVY